MIKYEDGLLLHTFDTKAGYIVNISIVSWLTG